jgi:SMI1/KNR4 family protein SUKH-1
MLRRLWERLRPRLTDEELAVARAFLDRADDPRYRLLTEQLIHAPTLRRSNPTPTSFEVYIGETSADFLVDLPDDKGVVSDWVRLRDESSGEQLEFSIEVHGSGIFAALRGRSAGRWPGKWRVAQSELQKIRPIVLSAFPATRDCLDALRARIGFTRVADGLTLLCSSPAAPEDLSELERREEAKLPNDYENVLSVANGLVLNGESLHGTRDLHVIELDNERWWVISSIAGEEFVVLATEVRKGQPVYLWPHDARSRAATNFRAFLEESLVSGSFARR